MTKQILAYLAFPLSKGSFRSNKSRVEKLALKIMAKNPEIYVVTAHHCTNYADKNGDKYRSIAFDLKIIEKSDLFILGSNTLDYKASSGCVWEYFFAKWLNKPIKTAEDLLSD